MVHSFGYSGYKLNDLFEGVSRAAQALQIQSEQFNRAVKQAFELSGFEEFSKHTQALEQRQKSLRYILELKKGLDIQPSLREKFLKLNGLPSRPQLTPRLKSDLENLRESLTSNLQRGLVNPITPRQTLNSPQQEIPQSRPPTVWKKSAFRPNAKLQRSVLIAIYKHLQDSQEQFVKWCPSDWFGEGSISRSDRVNWHNALKALVNKKLVQLHYPSGRKFVHNRGNAGTFISLTSEGHHEVSLLIQNN